MYLREALEIVLQLASERIKSQPSKPEAEAMAIVQELAESGLDVQEDNTGQTVIYLCDGDLD